MTTATLPRRLLRPLATTPARRSMLVGFAGTFVLGLLVLVGASASMAISAGPTALRGVTVGGVDVAGLDRAAAADRLAQELPSLSAGQAVISVGDAEQVVSYADLGRGYDTDAMLDAAFAVGRSRNPIVDGISRLRTLAHTTSLPVVVHAYDPDALARIVASVADAISHPPVEAAVIRDGNSFTVRPSDAGTALEPTAIADALVTAAATADPADVRLELTAATLAPIVDTAEAEVTATAASDMVAELELTIPGAGEDEAPIVISGETIAGWVSFGPEGALDYTARLERASITPAVRALAENVNQGAVNAQIGVASGGGLGGVIPGQNGRELNAAESVAGLVDALKQRASGGTVPSLALAVDVTQPSLTTAAATEMLPQMQLVSSWTTNYVPGDGNGYGANISIPAWDIDGTNLAPGDWFSFWGGIGPINTARGYTYGGAIINGRSVAQGALAGGICSTSTTLFNAAMRFGLEIGERDNHFYYIDRYPTGLDATVAIVDDSVKDMIFRNDTEHPIVIRGFGSPGQVTFQIWSVPNGRSVALSNPYITNRRAASETTQVSGDLAPGSARRVEYPHDGFDVSVSRNVYAADGSLLHQNTWFSDYRPVNGITLVGPPAAAPPADDVGQTAGEAATVGDPATP